MPVVGKPNCPSALTSVSWLLKTPVYADGRLKNTLTFLSCFPYSTPIRSIFVLAGAIELEYGAGMSRLHSIACVSRFLAYGSLTLRLFYSFLD